MPTPLIESTEKELQSPRATGVMVTDVRSGSPGAAAGILPGDVVTAVDGQAVTAYAGLLEALRPGEKPRECEMGIVTTTGARRAVRLAVGAIGIQGCAVRERATAWRPGPDSPDAPDFSSLARPGETWWRSLFGEERAGYERVNVRRKGDLVVLDHLTHFGGEAGPGRTWAYRAHVVSTHRLDAILTTVAIRATFGTEEEGQESSILRRAPDGSWSGEYSTAKGGTRTVSAPAGTPDAINTYAIPRLAMTMPLRTGASRTFPEIRETTAAVRVRSRLECLGRQEVKVEGKPVAAWCMAWKHYGEEDTYERFWVSDDRRLVRIDWGANYGGCWCELVKGKAEAKKGIPGHVVVA